MITPDLKVRRATIEDLPKLIQLWQEERLPVESLEKRFKEFQVVETESGEVCGTIGLLMEGQEGCLHSEAFAHPEEADAIRDLIWRRLQIMMRNFGLWRVWTQLATPFWHLNGFGPASDEVVSALPSTFVGEPHPWMFIKLKDEPAGSALSIDKEFAVFQEAAMAQTERIFRQARILKIVVTVIAAGLILLLLGSVAYLMFKKRARSDNGNPAPRSAVAVPLVAQVTAAEPSSDFL